MSAFTALTQGSSQVLTQTSARIASETVEHSLPYVTQDSLREDDEGSSIDKFSRTVAERREELRDRLDPFHSRKKIRDNINQDLVRESEAAGRLTGVAVSTFLAISGFVEDAPDFRSRVTAGFRRVTNAGVIPTFLSGGASMAVSLSRGRNWEEKSQGASLFLSDVTSYGVAAGLTKILEKKMQAPLHPIANYAIKGAGATALSIAITPLFGWGLRSVGRLIDQAIDSSEGHKSDSGVDGRHSRRLNDLSPPTSPPPAGEKKLRSKNTSKPKTRVKQNNRMDDERLSNKDIDEALARRIEHGRAF